MRRRQITTAVTMTVLCGVLVVGAVLGWRALFAELPDDETAASEPEPSCTTKQVGPGERLRARHVTVSVFNGGTRSGLAGDTQSALERRGFKAGEVGNAPSDADVSRVAVWSTEEGSAEARLVARQFGPRVRVTFSDVDLGPGVDVIVGNDFRGLVKAKRSIKVTTPEDVCIPGTAAETDTNAAA
jgi:hypothetical protein